MKDKRGSLVHAQLPFPQLIRNALRFPVKPEAAMMLKTVKRRMSAGLITTSTSGENERDFPELRFLRRINSAGWRAYTSSDGSESGARRDSLRSNVVTPDSIPQFTIPRLAVEDLHTHSPKDEETQPEEDTDHLHLSSSSVSLSSSSSSSPFSLSPALQRKARRSISDPENHKRISVRCSPNAFMESDQCSDITTRGALSLPHLAKITTPYGFVTLSQSPQMASETQLFLQTSSRSWAKGKRNMPSRSVEVETDNGSSGRTLPVGSLPDADSHLVSGGISNTAETGVCPGSSPSPAHTSRPKPSFWGAVRKHLSNQKLSKSI